MIEDHICDGDLILLERVPEVHDGDIVVALVSGQRHHAEALLSGTRRTRSGCSRPMPRSSRSWSPAADVQIQGRLLAVLRKYK